MLIKKLGTSLGVEISELNIKKDVNKNIISRIVDLLSEFSVVVIRAQNINNEEHITFSELFGNLDGRILSVGPAGAGFDVEDIESFYKNWLAELAVKYVIIRPDFYVAASANTSAELHACFDYLMTALRAPTG